MTLATQWRPNLSPSILLRYDHVRDDDLLVLPERVVVLGGSAAAVLRLCDGTREVWEIVEELAESFPGAPVETEVPAFLHRVLEEGWLR
ncbi:pyrroloquinoline quinone biosynthesis peptide chaperone PqqD [Streptomyces sp. XD-27]|uniref:pyrroloquinoline quinone biosynthesis peptide chaperone PqqD n=1 Tax=Streptomyces sp. XD-27 TaxID=3062779 RepID=UPI0026F44CE8|nr:pyrroloquinoline quinone biosynthesis peptide chaperone PqqD [Streptomyces sp. XD-27]WKX68854.1 pyrroloquinoline quinone biosynthesis peptide chaperone PqqD [Streptomyces sp. XD-27]